VKERRFELMFKIAFWVEDQVVGSVREFERPAQAAVAVERCAAGDVALDYYALDDEVWVRAREGVGAARAFGIAGWADEDVHAVAEVAPVCGPVGAFSGVFIGVFGVEVSFETIGVGGGVAWGLGAGV
jgi:hypothetical protein